MAEVDDWTTPQVDDWVMPGGNTAAPAEPADHGLSERQKLSPVGKALSPITGYWDTYQKMRGEGYEQAARGIRQMTHPESLIKPEAHGLYDVGAGALNTAAGGLNYLLGAPVNAAYRSIIGQPLEDVTGIPREYPEFAAQLATPGIGFGRLPKAPGAVAETMPKIKSMEGPDLSSMEAETKRALGREFGIDYTRGQATGDLEAIRREDMAARGAYGKEQQDLAAPKFNEQFQDIQSAGKGVGRVVSRREGPLDKPADAGEALNTEIADRAAAARAERDASLQQAEQDLARQQEQAEQALTQQQTQAEQGVARQRQQAQETGRAISERIAAAHPEIEHPLDAAEMVGERVRERAAQDRAGYQSSYREAYAQPGTFPAETFQGVGSRIRNDLTFRDEPVVIDESTPIASAALNAVDRIENLRLPNRADPRTGFADAPQTIDLQGLERGRKLLQSYYRRTAAGSEERRAVSAVIGEFDNQVERAISDGLFSGDPAALGSMQRARAQFRQYQQTYAPQGRDDVGTAMQRIVQRNATPEEISNMILGSGKIGATGTPVRIADRLEQVLGADSQEWNAIRQAQWQKASQVRNSAGEIDPLRSATNIEDFARSTLGQRMFPGEAAAMRNHAEGLRRLKAVEDNLPQAQRAAKSANAEATKAAQVAHKEATAKAHSAYEEAFGGGDLTGPQRGVFQRMAEGTATPEETANAMFSMIGSGNPGNAVRALNAIERIVGKDSPVMSNVRQGVWQKLTQTAYGKDQPGQQKIVQSINDFLNGNGRMIAKQLYTDEERALMSRYADAVRQTIIPKYSRTNSDTAVAAAAQAHRSAAPIASAIASMLHLGPLGHLGGHAVSKMIASRVKSLRGNTDLQSLGESLNDTIPPPPKAGPLPGPPSAFRPLPLAAAIKAGLGAP